MAIGAGWVDGAWVDAGWVSGAWASAAVSGGDAITQTGFMIFLITDN